MQTEKDRIQSIDGLRGIAVFGVCLFHFTNGNPTCLPEGNWLKLVGSFGWIGVYIFFVISGYIIPYSMGQNGYKIRFFRQFLLKRFIRVEIPYLVSIFLWLFSAYLVALFRQEIFTIEWGRVLAHFFYLTIFWGYEWLSPIYWTLAIEFQFYILIGVCYPLLFSTTFWKYVIPLIINSLSFVWIEGHWLFWYFPAFTMGIFVYQFQQKMISIDWLFVGGIALCWIMVERFGGVCALLVVCTALLIVFNKSVHITQIIGKISYSLYLTHIPLGGRWIGMMAFRK